MPGTRPAAADRRESSSPTLKIVLALALVGGMFLLCGGGLAGLAFFALQQHGEVAQQPPEQPPPELPPPPVVVPNPPPMPVPMPEPEPAPAPAPVPAEPVFRKVWAVEIHDGGKGGFVAISNDGAHVFARDGGGVRVLTAREGAHVSRLAGPTIPTGPIELWPLGSGKIALTGPPLQAPSLWHPATGTQPGELVPQRMLPPPSSDPTRYAIGLDGKHLFVGARLKGPGQPTSTTLFRIIDVSSNQMVGQGWWDGGNARFTADGTRILVAEVSGRCRWLQAAGGVQRGGWTYPAAGTDSPLLSLSADGKLAVYAGRPAGLETGRYLIDAQTGQVLRAVGPAGAALTADGRWVVGLADGEVIVADARTGAEAARETVPTGVLKAVAFRADGRAFVVHDGGANELRYYEARVPFAADARPTPDPLSPVPDPLQAVPFGPSPFPGGPPGFQPGFPPMPMPPFVTPMPPVTPRVTGPAVPPPPALKVRWDKAAEIGSLELRVEYAPHFTRDGGVIAQYGGNTGSVLGFDAADGTPLPGFGGLKANAFSGWVGTFGDRVAVCGTDGKMSVWLARTGAKTDPLPFPDLPAGGSTATPLRAVSPTGRYTALARRSYTPTRESTPVRVFDTTTGKLVVDATWQVSAMAGFVGFTADELRVLVVDGAGKGKWFRLPSGVLDSEWAVAEGVTVRNGAGVSMSADGTRLVYTGPLPGGGSGGALLDGKTGALLRRIDTPVYQPAAAALSPDGKLIAVPVREARDGVEWHVDVIDTATWTKLGRASPPREAGSDVALPRFSPDGKTLAVMFRAARRLVVYDTPVRPAPVPSATP